VTFATKGGLFSIVPELHPSTMTVKDLIYCSFRGGSKARSRTRATIFCEGLAEFTQRLTIKGPAA